MDYIIYGRAPSTVTVFRDRSGYAEASTKEVIFMAWVAVHEQIDGATLRQLRKEIGCSKLEALGILVHLWLWGLDNADRSGVLKSADADDVAEIFAFGLSKGIAPAKVVRALIDTGWIDLCEDQMVIHDWEDWQDQWYKALDRREKDKARKHGNSTEIPRKFRGKSAEIPVQPSPSPSPSPSSSPLPSPSKDGENKAAPIGADGAFDQFWREYPKKVGKQAAIKAFKRVKVPVDTLLTAIDRQKRGDQWSRDNGRYIPNPATWLNQGRWEDELEVQHDDRDSGRGKYDRGFQSAYEELYTGRGDDNGDGE